MKLIGAAGRYAIVLILWISSEIGYAGNTAFTTANCPITIGEAPADQLWKDVFRFGGEVLSVQLFVDGWWRGHGPEDNYRGRLWWFSDGYDGLTDSVRPLRVTGRRLDAEEAPANISWTKNATDGKGSWAMIVIAEFPSPGCWELSAKYGGQVLTFVVLVGDRQHPDPNDA